MLKLGAHVLDLQPSSPRKVFEMWRVCVRHCIARTYGEVWQVTTCLCQCASIWSFTKLYNGPYAEKRSK